MTEKNVEREFREISGLMLNVVSPFELFIRIEELLSDRMSRDPSQMANFCIRIDEQNVGIEVADGRVRAFGEAKGDCAFEIGPRGLAKIVSRLFLPSQLIQKGEAKAPTHLVKILDRLFPKANPHIYQPDEF